MPRIAIIGLGSAGYAALMTVKRLAPGAELIIIDPKEQDLMHPCGLPYSLEGRVNDIELCQNIFLNRMGVTRRRARALRIEPGKCTARAVDGDARVEIEFDAAIIATGSRPIIPPIKGAEKALGHGLYPLTTVEELLKIKGRLVGAGRGIVIGAGAIGLESAVALKRHLGSVTVLEAKNQVLPGVLDADMAKLVEEQLQKNSIELRLESAAEEFLCDDGLRGVLSLGGTYDADIGILATGFRADTSLAEESGIECGRFGIQVDEAMRTSMEGVYAAGDCISAWSVIDNEQLPVKLATCAYKQGQAAGANAAGGNAVYRGTAGTFVTKIGSLEVAGTGYSTETAGARGLAPVSGKLKAGILPDYFHGGSDITIKIICDKGSGKILGAQAVGERGAAERINIVSMAIEYGIGARELERVELAYCPAVSEVVDPLHKALEFTIRRMNVK